MRLRIVQKKLIMTRGDSEAITFSRTGKDGQAIPFVNGDKVYFSVKKSYSDTQYAFQKVVVSFLNGQTVFNIDPDDTKKLAAGTYKYDIQWTLANGEVKTPVKGDFVIEEDVTHE